MIGCIFIILLGVEIKKVDDFFLSVYFLGFSSIYPTFSFSIIKFKMTTSVSFIPCLAIFPTA